MEPAQSAQDPRRLVLEAPGAGGPVVLLREPDVAHAVEDPLEADLRLGAGERAARAGVGAAAEGDVLLAVGAADAELGGGLETPRVAVDRTVQEHDGGAGGDLHPGEGGAATGEAEVALDRALDPERLLDEVGDALALGPKLLLETGGFGQVLERGGEQPRGRLLAGGEEEGRGPHDVDRLGGRPV